MFLCSEGGAMQYLTINFIVLLHYLLSVGGRNLYTIYMLSVIYKFNRTPKN